VSSGKENRALLDGRDDLYHAKDRLESQQGASPEIANRHTILDLERERKRRGG